MSRWTAGRARKVPERPTRAATRRRKSWKWSTSGSTRPGSVRSSVAGDLKRPRARPRTGPRGSGQGPTDGQGHLALAPLAGQHEAPRGLAEVGFLRTARRSLRHSRSQPAIAAWVVGDPAPGRARRLA